MALLRKLKFSKRIPKLREVVAFAVMPGLMLMAMHAFFIYAHYYDWYFAWLDTPMHLLGGVVVAFAAMALFDHAIRVKRLPHLPRWFFFWSILGTVALIGIFWEFYEFLNDIFKMSAMQSGVADTMKDLSNDLLGGIIFLWIIKKATKR